MHISALLDVYSAFLGEKQRKLTAYYYNDDCRFPKSPKTRA
ncbi:MAG: hypothetical protein ACLR56_11865 [Oscillospiraceae bacterium]